jgi:hypothetical protein
MRYDEAVASLFQVPLEQFVGERKRLAGELKAAGDKDGAAKLAKLARPPISAWVVDQLWWHARARFEALFDTAQQLRDGKLDATAAHRDAIAKLRAQAAKILTDAEHGATEATLRRVTQTLSALAASGGWDPDPPGALSADRDPPGFEAVGISLAPPPEAHAAHKADGDATHAQRDATHDGHTAHARRDAKPHDIAAARERRDAKNQAEAVGRDHREAADAVRRKELEQAAERAEAAAQQRRAEADRAKATAERHRLEAALRTARGDVAQREREVGKLERDLAAARGMVAQAKAVVEGLEERLAQLDS